MYLPASFVEADQSKLQDFIEANSFGVLVMPGEQDLVASHLPFLLDRTTGTHGTLIGHLARANSQWQHIDEREVLVIFSGPHTYISPTWYQVELAVPTWNYIAVHAYGRLTCIEDPAALRQIVDASVERYERSQPVPWKLTAPQDFIDKLLAQIVGFKLEISRLEGKWKLNQNHPAERRERVINALRAQATGDSRAIADAMEATLD
jgi:transcriptional regulator